MNGEGAAIILLVLLALLFISQMGDKPKSYTYEERIKQMDDELNDEKYD